MTVEKIIALLNQQAPEASALDWDNVGLLVGDKDWPVDKVYIALDATDEVIEDAINQGAQMIITHHPMIFTSVNKVTGDHFVGRRIITLIEHRIAVYAMHTNFDIHGMTDIAKNVLGIKQSVVLDVCEEDEEHNEYGIGCVGMMEDA
ncbi:MAG: Nif3-like dinuclear metal center hexameric protein, partial [Lachnospiraceae bacterium]|nr:Nif3-like dinuclear metal center hexameric protein [Lachnospiraceae bacterium]